MDSIDIEHSDEEPDFDDFDEILAGKGAEDVGIEENGENNEGEEKPEAGEAKEVKKKRIVVRKPQPKLDTDRLKTERGLIALKEAQKGMVLKGKGNEARDLDHIMFTLEHWANRLFPKLSFDDFIEKTEKLGSKKVIATFVKKMRMGDTLDIRRENGDVIEEEVIDNRSEDEFIDDFEDDDHLLFSRNDNNGIEEEKESNKMTDEDYERNRNALFDSILNDKSDDGESRSQSRSVNGNQSENRSDNQDGDDPVDVEEGQAPFDSVLKQVLDSSDEDEAKDNEKEDSDDELIKRSRSMRKRLLEEENDLRSDSDESNGPKPSKKSKDQIPNANEPKDVPFDSALKQFLDSDDNEDDDDEVLVRTPSIRRKRILEDDEESIRKNETEEMVVDSISSTSKLESDDEADVAPVNRRKRTRIIEDDDEDETENSIVNSNRNVHNDDPTKDVRNEEPRKEEPVKKNVTDEENRALLYDGPNIEWSDFGL